MSVCVFKLVCLCVFLICVYVCVCFYLCLFIFLNLSIPMWMSVSMLSVSPFVFNTDLLFCIGFLSPLFNIYKVSLYLYSHLLSYIGFVISFFCL